LITAYGGLKVRGVVSDFIYAWQKPMAM